MQEHVTNVLHRLSGQSDEQSKQQNSDGGSPELIMSGIPGMFPDTMEEMLTFVQEEDYMEDLACQVKDADTQREIINDATEDIIAKEHRTTQRYKKQKTKGAIFSKGFIKRIIRRISTSDTGWKTTEDSRRCNTETTCNAKEELANGGETTAHTTHIVATKEKIREIFDKEMARCGDTAEDTKDTVEEWVQELSRAVQQFGPPHNQPVHL